MGKLIYDETSLNDFKDVVNQCNNDIYDALKKISTEVDNIEEILKTPKSVTTTDTYNEYFKTKAQYLNTNIGAYNALFDGIISTYQENFNALSNMVGDNND